MALVIDFVLTYVNALYVFQRLFLLVHVKRRMYRSDTLYENHRCMISDIHSTLIQ